MDLPEIKELATMRPKESLEVLLSRMSELRSNGAGLLDCVVYVRTNQGCGLAEATHIVINSSAWLDRKDDFLQQQSEAFEEFLETNRDRIAAIHETYTPDGTETVLHLLPNNQKKLWQLKKLRKKILLLKKQKKLPWPKKLPKKQDRVE